MNVIIPLLGANSLSMYQKNLTHPICVEQTFSLPTVKIIILCSKIYNYSFTDCKMNIGIQIKINLFLSVNFCIIIKNHNFLDIIVPLPLNSPYHWHRCIWLLNILTKVLSCHMCQDQRLHRYKNPRHKGTGTHWWHPSRR